MDPIISKTQFVALVKKANTDRGGSRANYAFRRGGSFDVVTMPGDPTPFAVLADPQNLTDEQRSEILAVLKSLTPTVPEDGAPTPPPEDLAPQLS